MKLKPSWFYPFALFVSVICSLGGIVVAVCWTKNPNDAGRGGALAVALSFGILIVNRNFGDATYSMVTESIPEMLQAMHESGLNVQRLQERAEKNRDDALAKKSRIDGHDQKVQNRYLAASSVFGTLAWGFADIPASWLISQIYC